MEVIKSVLKIGNSKAITLPKEIADVVIIGDKLLFDVRLIKKMEDRPTKDYSCRACEHNFPSNDILPYCPICGKEDVEESK